VAKRGLRAGAISAAAIAAAVAGGIAAERAFVRRDRSRADPFAKEAYGSVRGASIGPIPSFDGTLLNVEQAGSGPTVVFSHGFSLNLTLWHHQITGLAEDMRLVLYDHRGHGRSGRPESQDWSLEALARDLHAVLSETTGDGPAVVVGHSMGGMTALKYCELFGEQIGRRVGGLVLVDTTAADVMGGVLYGAGRRARAVSQALQEGLMRALTGRADTVDRMRANGSSIAYLSARFFGFGPSPSPAQVDFVERMLAEVPSEVWERLLPTLLGFDVTTVLPVIDIPVLIIVGSHDRLTPPGASVRMARAIPGAELVVLKGAGHSSMLERHEEFNDHVRRFVARVAATTTR